MQADEINRLSILRSLIARGPCAAAGNWICAGRNTGRVEIEVLWPRVFGGGRPAPSARGASSHQPRGAGFQTCCIAGFPTGFPTSRPSDSWRSAAFKAGDTAGLEAYATSPCALPSGGRLRMPHGPEAAEFALDPFVPPLTMGPYMNRPGYDRSPCRPKPAVQVRKPRGL